jgi:hypothetical protein
MRCSGARRNSQPRPATSLVAWPAVPGPARSCSHWHGRPSPWEEPAVSPAGDAHDRPARPPDPHRCPSRPQPRPDCPRRRGRRRLAPPPPPPPQPHGAAQHRHKQRRQENVAVPRRIPATTPSKGIAHPRQGSFHHIHIGWPWYCRMACVAASQDWHPAAPPRAASSADLSKGSCKVQALSRGHKIGISSGLFSVHGGPALQYAQTQGGRLRRDPEQPAARAAEHRSAPPPARRICLREAGSHKP